MNPEIKVKKDGEYYDKNDVVIEKTVEVTKPVETIVTSMTIGEIKQKITDLKESKIAKNIAYDAQIAELEAMLESTKKEVDKIEILDRPEEARIVTGEDEELSK
jgi:hypothetical protein